MCSHWSCLCSSYRALHSVEEKRGSWQEQGSKETLAEVWSRRVSVASAQSSPFSGPRGWIWKQCSRRPWRRFDCTSNHSLGAAPGPHNLLYLHYFLCPRSFLCPHCLLSPHHLLSLEAACGLHPPPAVYWAQLTVLSLPPLPTTYVAVECLPLSLLSGSFAVLWQTSISSHRFDLELPGEAPWGETGVSPHCTSLGFGTCEAIPVGRVPFGQTQGSTPAADLAGRGVNMGTSWGCADLYWWTGCCWQGTGWSSSPQAVLWSSALQICLPPLNALSSSLEVRMCCLQLLGTLSPHAVGREGRLLLVRLTEG